MLDPIRVLIMYKVSRFDRRFHRRYVFFVCFMTALTDRILSSGNMFYFKTSLLGSNIHCLP